LQTINQQQQLLQQTINQQTEKNIQGGFVPSGINMQTINQQQSGNNNQTGSNSQSGTKSQSGTNSQSGTLSQKGETKKEDGFQLKNMQQSGLNFTPYNTNQSLNPPQQDTKEQGLNNTPKLELNTSYPQLNFMGGSQNYIPPQTTNIPNFQGQQNLQFNPNTQNNQLRNQFQQTQNIQNVPNFQGQQNLQFNPNTQNNQLRNQFQPSLNLNQNQQSLNQQNLNQQFTPNIPLQQSLNLNQNQQSFNQQFQQSLNQQFQQQNQKDQGPKINQFMTNYRDTKES